MKSTFLVIATALASIAGKTVASNPLTSPSITSLLPTSLIFLGFQVVTATADSDTTIAEIREAVFAEDTAVDAVEQCDFWAENGECSHNPRYMLENCGNACRRQERIDREIGRLIDSKISHIGSFFQLEAEDIDGNTISFEQFRGKVTVITNVASYCGYTESHYRGLVELYNKFKDSAVGFNILAFPCNQFGEQEPNSCSEIKRFVENKGVEFTMMNKIDVNGMDAHDVYHYLKKVAGPPRITWNFATYYVVTPGGVVSSYSGVEPMELSTAIVEAMIEAGAESDEL